MAKPGEKKKSWLDPASVKASVSSIYPATFTGPLAGREKRALGDPLGLIQIGVNLVTLAPGSWSSLPMRARRSFVPAWRQASLRARPTAII
jgi:hypothetical protein